MRYMMFASLVLFMVVAGLGCGNDSLLSVDGASAAPTPTVAKSNGGVAVIDVDIVAKQLQSYDEIASRVKKLEGELNEKLRETQKNYRSRIQREEEALSNRSTVVDLERLDVLKKELNAELVQDRAQAQRDLKVFRANLVNAFRDRIRPVAQQVASSKGLSLVVSKNDSVVFSYEPAIDITNDVIAKMSSTPRRSK